MELSGRCGDWINEELALFLNARVALACGNAAAALDLASAGLAVIADHGRRPLDTARFHLLQAVSFGVLGDADAQTAALAAADAAATELTADTLKQRYAVERAKTCSALAEAL